MSRVALSLFGCRDRDISTARWILAAATRRSFGKRLLNSTSAPIASSGRPSFSSSSDVMNEASAAAGVFGNSETICRRSASAGSRTLCEIFARATSSRSLEAAMAGSGFGGASGGATGLVGGTPLAVAFAAVDGVAAAAGAVADRFAATGAAISGGATAVAGVASAGESRDGVVGAAVTGGNSAGGGAAFGSTCATGGCSSTPDDIMRATAVAAMSPTVPITSAAMAVGDSALRRTGAGTAAVAGATAGVDGGRAGGAATRGGSPIAPGISGVLYGVVGYGTPPLLGFGSAAVPLL